MSRLSRLWPGLPPRWRARLRLPAARLSHLLFLRSILVATITFAIVYPLVVGWLLPQNEGEVERRQIQLARAIRAQVESVLDGPRFAVSSFARILADLGRGPEATLSARLDAFVDAGSGFSNVYLLDGLGMVVGVGVESERRLLRDELIGLDFSSHPLWRLAQDAADVRWTDAFLSPVSARRTVAVAYRIGAHTVIAELQLKDFMTRVQGLSEGSSVATLVLDRRGHVLVDSSADPDTHHQDFSGFDFVRDRSRDEWPLVHFEMMGEEMVGSLLRIPELDWRVLVMRPTVEAYRPARTAGAIMMLGLLCAVVLGLAGAGMQAALFGRQFRSLGEFAEQVARGDYGLRWRRSRVVEFNELAAAFGGMSEAIHSREEAIAASQAAYREILESTSELVLRLDDVARVEYANPAFCRLLGVMPEALAGRPLDAYLQAEEGAGGSWCDAAVAALRAGAPTASFEGQVVDRAGGHHRVAWTLHLGERGKGGIAAIGHDLTARWLAAEALRRSEARLRAMLDNATEVAIQWYDAAGRVVYWNPGSERLYGFTAAQAVGRTLEQLVLSPRQAEQYAQMLAGIDRAGGTRGPELMEVRRADGRVLQVLATLFAIPAEEEGDYYIVGIDLDVTAQLEEESARREAERKFSAVFQASPVPMAVWSADLRLVDANAAWERLFGFDAEASRGRVNHTFGLWCDTQQRASFFERIAAAPLVQAEEAWMQPQGGGRRRLCEVSGNKVELASLGVMFVVAYEDITAEREAAQQLRELNDTLELRVSERTAELSAALDHLRVTQEGLLRSEKMAALGSLVAGVAHELSTPLGNSLIASNTVRDHTRAMQRELAQGLKRSSLERYLEETVSGNDIIERNLGRAAELVASFRQVAVDQASSQRREFALTEVVDEIAMTLRPSLKRLPYALETEVAEGLMLDSYPGPLGQVLTNLINNAITHAFEGRDSGRVKVSGRADGEEHVLIEVSDDGCGIPPGHLRRIFDPFFTTRLGQGGSGLGLHIVDSLVRDLLGGSIDVSSAPGCGTTMRLRLPRRPGVGALEPLPAAGEESASTTDAGKGVKDA